MEAALRLVSDNDALFPWPDTGEALTTEQAVERVKGLLYENEGLTKLTKKQAKENAKLERQLDTEETRPHPKDNEFRELGKRWKDGTGKKQAKIGLQRMKMMRARHKDGFPITSDEAEPTLELAIDGLCAFPYRVYGERFRQGKPSELDNDLDAALKDEKHVEALSRLGWKARQAGWTPENGWPA